MTFGCWQLVYLHRSGWIPEICGALAKSLPPYFFSAQMHLPTSLKGWSPFIWISGRCYSTGLNWMLKRHRAKWLRSRWLVFCSAPPSAPSPLHLHSHSLPGGSTKQGQGQALSRSYILHSQGPHPHTWLLPRRNVSGTQPVHLPRQINKSREGLANPYRRRGKIKLSHCRGQMKTYISV